MMKRIKALLPQFGMGMQDAEIVKWLKEIGDRVTVGDDLVEISAAKVMVTIPSPATGTLVEILVAEGETALVRTVLAHIDVD
jgi:pyruvate/2-oxoglutarate dehydrogenase complex dihydrolipoamide acyltransferase (E2) component